MIGLLRAWISGKSREALAPLHQFTLALAAC
jgi:hypothetical protein